jgi:hypothetical protein
MLILALGLLLVSQILIVNHIFTSSNDWPYDYSFTKAICTENNFCQDYQIFCKEKRAVLVSPITGAVVQFSQDWKDPRSEEFRNKIC